MTEFRAQLEADRIEQTYGVKTSLIGCDSPGCNWHIIVTQHLADEQAEGIVRALGGVMMRRGHSGVTWCPTCATKPERAVR